MNLIDGKGRIFGKMNLLDAIIVGILIIVIILGVQFFFIGREHTMVAVGMVSNNIPYYVMEELTSGEIYDSVGNVIGQIEQVRKYPGIDGSRANLDLFVTTDKTYIGGKLAFNKKQILVGMPISIETETVALSGVVTYIGKVPETSVVKKNVTLLVEGQKEYVVDALHIGEEYVFDGRVISSIYDIHVADANSMPVTVASGELRHGQEDMYDLYILVEMECEMRGDWWYCNDQLLRILGGMPIYMEDMVLWGTVVSIET